MAAQPAAALTAAWNEASGAVYPWAYDNALTGWHLADGAMSFAPVVDGDFIQCKITECLDSGTFNPAIDVLFGTNSGDGATFVYAVPEALTYTEYELAVAAIWAKPQGTPQAIVDFYASAFPPATTPDGRLPLAQAVNDYLFRCSSEVYGRAVASSGGRAFAYVFDHVYSNAWLFTEFGLAAVCESVACHCEEIPFVFNNTVPSLNATFTPDEVVLATQMVAWWTNFARDGDPNGAGGEPADSTLLKSQAPVWPAFDGDLRQAMHITAPASFVESGGVETCAGFWDGLGYLY
jgi:carboxylesterase type B